MNATPFANRPPNMICRLLHGCHMPVVFTEPKIVHVELNCSYCAWTQRIACWTNLCKICVTLRGPALAQTDRGGRLLQSSHAGSVSCPQMDGSRLILVHHCLLGATAACACKAVCCLTSTDARYSSAAPLRQKVMNCMIFLATSRTTWCGFSCCEQQADDWTVSTHTALLCVWRFYGLRAKK